MDSTIKKESRTISHYDKHAEDFWLGTKDHDVSQNTQAFLSALPKNKVLDIFRFGLRPRQGFITF